MLKDSQTLPSNPGMVPPMGWPAARKGVMKRFAQLVLATHHPGIEVGVCVEGVPFCVLEGFAAWRGGGCMHAT